tara:strand:+ start:3767 stop:4306 length:540 start_codon:yes stop_codon:yes gene_type:complete
MPKKKTPDVFALTLSALKGNPFFGTPLHIVILLVYVVLILFTLKYLNDLEKCECFNNETYKTNLTFLKVFEVIMLCGIATTAYFIFKLKTQKGGNNGSLIGILLGVIITLTFHFFVVMNVWRLYKNVDSDCKCSAKWQQYFVYYQGLSSSFILASNVVGFLLFLIGGFLSMVGSVKKLS